jgi:hypothetical protein
MAGLRIFSYLPNPRVWKATIAARFCGVDVEIRGAPGCGITTRGPSLKANASPFHRLREPGASG